jgi:two-component system, OmpR family, response regulator VicR
MLFETLYKIAVYMGNVKLVAVIDDEPDILLTVSTILKRNGYNVITSNTAEDITHILDLNPQLILVDMNMPGKQGTDLCRELKNAELTRNIRIIITSGNPHLEDAYKECGADSFLQKPFEKDQLLQIIAEIIAV